jgi:hypothetical protein
MFALLHSDINPFKSGLINLTGQLKDRATKVKMELETEDL